MANKRNYEWPLASVFDGFFTQDKSGGVTERVSPALVVSAVQSAGVFQPLGADLTAIEALSTSGYLRRTGTNTWTLDSAATPASHAASHLFDGPDAIPGQSLSGLRTTDSPEFNRTTLGSELRLKRSGVQEWGFVAGTSGLEIASRNSDWSAIDWPIVIGHDAGGVIRLGGTTSRPVNLTYSLQLGGVDTITSTREGRFTGLRLSNMSSGQIPVASNANGQITASGLTDDGTFLGASRVLRMWNSLARSGNTWTDLQWSQDVNERVSVLSSNSSGQYAYHSWVFVPADSEATGRVLGGQMWAQKVSGKSGTAPGLKAAMYAKTAGTGGSTGGFGAQIVFNYRPDNGATQVDALKIGAFGGGVADAVETAILLRANADFMANYAKIQKDADASVGLDVVGPSGTGKFRMLNSGGGSVLGINAGSLEISCANGVGIGTAAGNASILVSTGDVSIAKTYFSSTHRVVPTERNSSASTAIGDRLVVYTGTTNQTESLPAATGSNRVIEFAHSSSSGTWTLDAAGTDEIAGELQARVGSIAILSNSSVKNRTLIDFAPGLWVVI